MFPPVIDSSILATFKSCEAKGKLEYIDNWKPKEGSVHLKAGGAFAKGMEVTRQAFYEGIFETAVRETNLTNNTSEVVFHRQQLAPGDSESSIACGLQALLFEYGDFQCPADSAKSPQRMAGAFEFYFEHYPLDAEHAAPILLPGGKRGIEFSFAHPLPITHPDSGDPILYSGRMDAIVSAFGGTHIMDEKTTTQLGSSWSRQWDLRSQFTGYAWGCAQSGIHVDGVVVRGVSILKTKYDTQEAVSYRPNWQIDRWYDEMLEWVESMKTAYQRGRFKHNLDHTCTEYGGCAFRDVCRSQDESSYLDTYFEQRVWNPLTRLTTKV